MNVIDDATLLKMAEAEILGEAKRAAVRHSIAGVSGWQPCPKPNKVFLTNTLLQTISRNRKKNGEKSNKKRDRKLLQTTRKGERTNFVFQKPSKSERKSVTKTTESNRCKSEKITHDKNSEKTLKRNEKCTSKKIKSNKT